jgi:hypothetical protein
MGCEVVVRVDICDSIVWLIGEFKMLAKHLAKRLGHIGNPPSLKVGNRRAFLTALRDHDKVHIPLSINHHPDFNRKWDNIPILIL